VVQTKVAEKNEKHFMPNTLFSISFMVFEAIKQY
jgi:hypothetical protein